MTKFVVFVQGLDNAWRDAKNVEASSQEAAIRIYVEAVVEAGSDDLIFGDKGAEIAAVPARSWKPQTVKVAKTTKVSFGSNA